MTNSSACTCFDSDLAICALPALPGLHVLDALLHDEADLLDLGDPLPEQAV